MKRQEIVESLCLCFGMMKTGCPSFNDKGMLTVCDKGRMFTMS